MGSGRQRIARFDGLPHRLPRCRRRQVGSFDLLDLARQFDIFDREADPARVVAAVTMKIPGLLVHAAADVDECDEVLARRLRALCGPRKKKLRSSPSCPSAYLRRCRRCWPLPGMTRMWRGAGASTASVSISPFTSLDRVVRRRQPAHVAEMPQRPSGASPTAMTRSTRLEHARCERIRPGGHEHDAGEVRVRASRPSTPPAACDAPRRR